MPITDGGDQACYLPKSDRIQLPDRGAFHSAAGLYATWAHEAIHSTGHSTRLARDLSRAFGSWIAMLHESPELLFQVLSEARKAADLICPEEPEPIPHPQAPC